MQRFAVLTSGGDAPGMNAAIRSVVRVAAEARVEVMGIWRGYAGLLDGMSRELGPRDVGGIMQTGGTILGSSRSDRFRTPEGQEEAVEQLHQMGADGLIVIGGNGSQTGANALSKLGVPVVGIASTIDNDLYGFDITIGVDTALNIALEAIDRLRVTASSHERAFLVEVMGRSHGYIAMVAGLAGGAEAIVISERETTPDELAAEIREAYNRGKPHAIAVVSEGAKYDGDALVAHFKQHKDELGFELRLTKLGHVQRGGAPGVRDRMLGLRTGYVAAERLHRGRARHRCGRERRRDYLGAADGGCVAHQGARAWAPAHGVDAGDVGIVPVRPRLDRPGTTAGASVTDMQAARPSPLGP